MIWIHLSILPEMLKTDDRRVTQDQLSKSTETSTSQNFGHLHFCRPTEIPEKSTALRGCARPILVRNDLVLELPSHLTVKQGHPLVCSLPFHPERKKGILHNSGLNAGINSHTDYKYYRGKIRGIVSKSKNRFRLMNSTLVIEHWNFNPKGELKKKKSFLN